MASFQDQLRNAGRELVPIVEQDKKRGIHIVADKDTDGILSSVILYSAMKSLGYENVSLDIIPEDQGHTLTDEFLQKIKEDSRPNDIIITADIGIESQRRLEHVFGHTRTLITTDHHPDRYNDANRKFIDQVVDPLASDERYSDAKYEHFCGANVDSLLYETTQKYLNRTATETDIAASNPLQMFELIAALADRQDPNFQTPKDNEWAGYLQKALPRNRQILENAVPMLERLVTQTDPIPTMQPPEADLPLKRLGILINKTLDQPYVKDADGKRYDRIRNNPFEPKAGRHQIEDELRVLQRYIAPVLNSVKHIGLGREELIDFFTNPDADIEDDLHKLFDYNEIRSDLSRQWSPKNLENIADGTDMDACGMNEDWPYPGMRGAIAGPLANTFGHPVTFIGPQEENDKGQLVWRCTTIIPDKLDDKTLKNLSSILTKAEDTRNDEEILVCDSLKRLLGEGRWKDLCKGSKAPEDLNGIITGALKNYAKSRGGFVENNIITIALSDEDLPKYRMQMQCYVPASQKAEKLVCMTSPTVDQLLPLDRKGRQNLCQQYTGSERSMCEADELKGQREKRDTGRLDQLTENDESRQDMLKENYVPIPAEMVKNSNKNQTVYFRDNNGHTYRYKYKTRAEKPQKDDKYPGQLLIPKGAVFAQKDNEKEVLSAEQVGEKAQKMLDARKNTIPEDIEKTKVGQKETEYD